MSYVQWVSSNRVTYFSAEVKTEKFGILKACADQLWGVLQHLFSQENVPVLWKTSCLFPKSYLFVVNNYKPFWTFLQFNVPTAPRLEFSEPTVTCSKQAVLWGSCSLISAVPLTWSSLYCCTKCKQTPPQPPELLTNDYLTDSPLTFPLHPVYLRLPVQLRDLICVV